MVMALVGTVIAPDRTLALPKLYGTLAGFAVFYAVVNMPHARGEGLGFLYVILLMGLGVSLMAVVGTDWPRDIPSLDGFYGLLPRLIDGIPRSERGGLHHNQVAGVLAAVLPVSISLLGASDDRWPEVPGLSNTRAGDTVRSQWAVRVVLLVQTVTLLLTQSSLGLVVAAVGMAVLLRLERAPSWRGSKWVLLCTLLMAFVLLARMVTAQRFGTLSYRGELWTIARDLVARYPFTGVGLGNFPIIARLRYTLSSVPVDSSIGHAHNAILQMACDTGVAGAAASALVVMQLALLSHRLLEADWGQDVVDIRGGVIASVACFLLMGAIDCYPLGNKFTFLFWSLCGMLVWLAQRRQQELAS